MDLRSTLESRLRLSSGERHRMEHVRSVVEALELPPPVFKTCPWQPRDLVETGLRQWLRCCGVALGHRRVIGMPSRAVDEAWHGLILCTATYSAFCNHAYGRYLHHHPEGADQTHFPGSGEPMHEQLGRTVVAWSLVAKPDEHCVLWDLDQRIGLDQPWGVNHARVAAIDDAVTHIRKGDGTAGRRAEAFVTKRPSLFPWPSGRRSARMQEVSVKS